MTFLTSAIRLCLQALLMLPDCLVRGQIEMQRIIKFFSMVGLVFELFLHHRPLFLKVLDPLELALERL